MTIPVTDFKPLKAVDGQIYTAILTAMLHGLQKHIKSHILFNTGHVKNYFYGNDKWQISCSGELVADNKRLKRPLLHVSRPAHISTFNQTEVVVFFCFGHCQICFFFFFLGRGHEVQKIAWCWCHLICDTNLRASWFQLCDGPWD